MRERERERDEPRLFDLPLESEPDEEPQDQAGPATRAEPAGDDEALESPEPAAASPESAEASGSDELPLFGPRPDASSPSSPTPSSPPAPDPHPGGERSATGPVPVPAPPRGPRSAPFRPRLIAALADLGVYAAVLVVGLLGAFMAGAAPTLAKAPAFGLFLLSFSFLYGVVSLAFWGQTPGMAAAGVVARGGGDRPLTFGQTGLRWVAGVLTAALCGLPLLLALSGRSLADRLSSSQTFVAR